MHSKARKEVFMQVALNMIHQLGSSVQRKSTLRGDTKH